MKKNKNNKNKNKVNKYKINLNNVIYISRYNKTFIQESYIGKYLVLI